MFEAIVQAAVDALNSAGINAVTEYPQTELCSLEPVVCVGLRSIKLVSSGVGNYIGIYEEENGFREMYGAKAQLTLSVRILCLDADNAELVYSVYDALCGMENISIRSFEAGKTEYDKVAGMFGLTVTADAVASLVCDLRTPEEYVPGG